MVAFCPVFWPYRTVRQKVTFACSLGKPKQTCGLPSPRKSVGFSAAVQAGDVIERGEFVPVDSEGFLELDSIPAREVPASWREIISSLVDWVIAAVPRPKCIVSMYVRGSVVRGEVIPEKSDLDLVVYCSDTSSVDYVKAACRSFPTKSLSLSRIDCSAFCLNSYKADAMPYALGLQAFGVCVYGDDIVRCIPACRVDANAGIDIVRDKRVAFQEAERCRMVSDQDGERKVLQWLLKRALRSCAELCAPIDGWFARDLVPCVRCTAHFPCST